MIKNFFNLFKLKKGGARSGRGAKGLDYPI